MRSSQIVFSSSTYPIRPSRQVGLLPSPPVSAGDGHRPAARMADEADALHIVDISGSPRRGPTAPPGNLFRPAVLCQNPYSGSRDGSPSIWAGGSTRCGGRLRCSAPSQVGVLDSYPSAMSALFYQASHLLAYYEGSYYSGAALHFVNVTDPAHPVETAVFEPTFYGADLAASNGYIAFADDENGQPYIAVATDRLLRRDGPVDFSPTASVTYRVMLPACCRLDGGCTHGKPGALSTLSSPARPGRTPR